VADTVNPPESMAAHCQQAEVLALETEAQPPENLNALPLEVLRQKIRELQSHQIDLELRNEELRRTHGELSDSLVRYFDLYDMAPVGYVTVNAQGLVQESNLTAAAMLGVPLAELVRQPITRFISAEDMGGYDLHRRRLFEAFEPQECELRMTRTSGAPFWAQLQATAAQDAAGARVCRIVMSDVTERKQVEQALQKSEQQYQELASKIRIGVYIMRSTSDGACVLDFASSRMAEVFRVPVQSLLMDPETVPRAIHPDDLDSFLAATREGIRRQESFEWNGRAVVAGTVKWLHFESSPEPMACGDIHWHGFVVDITERKQLEAERAELEVRNRQLHKTESLGRMAGAIAHHFNNKLQAVMGNLELIGELPVGMDRAKFVVMAKQATEDAAAVSRMMLLYLGQCSLEGKPRLLSEICFGSLPRIQEALPSSVTLETDWSFPGPVIRANEEQIHQVLNSLIINAGEAMGGVCGSLRLSVRQVPAADISPRHRFPVGWQPQGGEYACLEVADSGCGIAGMEIEKVCDPFFSTKAIGRGLGLSVILGIVQAHGGAITVESHEGQGSVFRVYWPVHSETSPGSRVLEAEASKPEGHGTILLVDDDEIVLEVTESLIAKMGFTVLTAKDGVEALEVFEHHRREIRCVITDLTMPRMDGWETLAALRQLEPSLPVILASGYDKSHVMAGALANPPQAFLAKPFDRLRLRNALVQVLGVEGITKT
jgi:PAS domain S-box-containing protein